MSDLPAVPRRRLGRTELSIPVVPFGTQGFGNNFGPVSDEEAVELIRHAVDLGVNHFDCARCYGDSLRKLGVALKQGAVGREEVIITGRLCCHSSAEWGGYRGDGPADYSAERVIRDVGDQLEILGTDHFDGMLIHDPGDMEPTLAQGGTLAGVLECKERGWVNFAGYGMRPHDFHLKAIATGDIDLILCFSDYNLLRQTAADDILPAAAAADIGVMNGWSIMRGMLTGVNMDEAIANGRWRRSDDVDGARERWAWCQEEGVDLLQLALQFCLKDERIAGNNIGSLNKEQLEANIRAAATPVADEVWEKYHARFG
ncbi:MAG: aldo/keto reductase [bacterium]|nr:aldo/keto reductase [bacterium]